jgi:hypothetical protein
MSERHKPHNGRDKSGHFKVRQVDVEELPEEYLRDDVRLGGAVEDVGPQAGQHGLKISKLIEANRGSAPKKKDRGGAKGR